jgi:hypothetical protein
MSLPLRLFAPCLFGCPRLSRITRCSPTRMVSAPVAQASLFFLRHLSAVAGVAPPQPTAPAFRRPSIFLPLFFLGTASG